MNNENSCLKLVRSRRSVRTFDGTVMPGEEIHAILDYAASVETPYQLPITWRVLNAKEQKLSCPVITGTDIFIAGKMKRAPHAEEAFGYAFERIVLFAQERGVGTTWIGGTMDRAAFERAIELADDEVMPCVSPLGHPASKLSLRESMMRKGVKADTRLDFKELFFRETFDSPLLEGDAGNIRDVLEMVRWAPSAVNRQPWRLVLCGDTVHFYEKQSRGFVDKTGWDMQKIDLGIAMCHFAAGVEAQGRKPEFSIEDPGIPAPPDTIYLASCCLRFPC